MRPRLEVEVRIESRNGTVKRGRLTSSVIRCKNGIIVLLAGYVGQDLTTSAGGIDQTDCRSEAGEACAV